MNLFTSLAKRLNYVYKKGVTMITSKQSKTELVKQNETLQAQLAVAKTSGDVREMVHNIINYTNDEIGRLLAASMTPDWSEKNKVDLINDQQARALLQDLQTAVKESAFMILSKS